jgi:hypothetical protein
MHNPPIAVGNSAQSGLVIYAEALALPGVRGFFGGASGSPAEPEVAAVEALYEVDHVLLCEL